MSEEKPQGTNDNPIEEDDEDPPAIKAGTIGIGVTGKVAAGAAKGAAVGAAASGVMLASKVLAAAPLILPFMVGGMAVGIIMAISEKTEKNDEQEETSDKNE